MDFTDAVFTEELRVDSSNKTLDRLFRASLSDIFSSSMLKKIDRVFDSSLVLKNFNRRTNIMCYTQGTKIYINKPLFENTPKEKALNYLMHELIHVLINTGKFPELKTLQNNLANVISKAVKKEDISEFLTGKKQDIHSAWQGETINYLFNNSIKWDKAVPGTKLAYYITLKQSNIFKLN